MDRFDFSDLGTADQQSLLFGAYSQPSTLKRQQTYPPNFSTPIYNSIEDWSAAELSTDSAPSPGSASPTSPIFSSFSFPSNQQDWLNGWDKFEESPDDNNTNFFFKSEFEGPDLTSIPSLNTMDMSSSQPPSAMDDVVVFGREGLNDEKPLFQSNPPLTLDMPQSTTKSSKQVGLPTPPEASSQERRYPARSNNNLKRKSSEATTASSYSSPRSSCSPPPPQRRHTETATTTAASTAAPKSLGPKKTAHNMIEKRYRTNLNDKIAALRDSVPALRVMVHRLEHTDETALTAEEKLDEATAQTPTDEDLGGLTPAHKLNKATILSKATEYIAHLERKNRDLATENAALRNRVEGFEMLVMSRNGQRGIWG